MDARTINHVAAELLKKIEAFSQEPEPVPILGANIDIELLKTIEARISFDVLIGLLRKYAKREGDDQNKVLADFREFFLIRWRIIQSTDCAYTMSPYSSITRACFCVAECLSAFDEKHAYDWLMPTIDFQHAPYLDRQSFYQYKPHEFFLGSTNTPFALDVCFQFLEARAEQQLTRKQSTRVLKLSGSNTELGSLLKSLSMEDEAIVGDYSVPAKEYYDAIYFRDNTAKAKEQFHESMENGQVKILASYGAQGRKYLLESLLANVKSPLSMADFLYKHVPKNHWRHFLSMLSNDQFFSIVLNLNLISLRYNKLPEEYVKVWYTSTDDILNKFSRGRFKLHDEDELRALMLCLFTVYRIAREEAPEYKSNFGYIGSFFSMAQSKEARLQECDVLISFVTKMPPVPLSDFKSFLVQHSFKEHVTSLTEPAKFGSNNTLFNLVTLMLENAKQFEHTSEHQASISYNH